MRPGIGGEPFACLKFRTMRSRRGPDAGRPRVAQRGHRARCSRSAHDPRLTRVGRFLRRYSLDELPQLFNVLARPDVARRPAAAAAARLRPARGVAQEALPRAARASPACGRCPAARSSTSTTSCGSTSSTWSAGRSASTWRSCSRPCPPCSAGAARSELLAARSALLALAAPGDAAHNFAVSVVARRAAAGGGAAGAPRARRGCARRFESAGLDVRVQRFSTPRGRSRNVIGVRRGRRAACACVMAHADTVPPSPGAEDNASGLGAAGGAGAAAGRDRPAVHGLARRHRRRGAHLHRLARPPRRAGADRDRPARAAALRALARRGRPRHAVPPALAGRRAARGASSASCSRAARRGRRVTGSATTPPATPTTASSSSPACAASSSACSTTRAATPRATRRTASSARLRRVQRVVEAAAASRRARLRAAAIGSGRVRSRQSTVDLPSIDRGVPSAHRPRGAIQATPVILDAEACVAKAIRLLEEAAGQGAELAVLPETFIPLYPSNRWAKGAAGFGGWDELWERLHANSVDGARAAGRRARRGVRAAQHPRGRRHQRARRRLALQRLPRARARTGCSTSTAS